MKVPFSYLSQQFAKPDVYLKDIKKVVVRGDFTLGKEVTEFEKKFAAKIGTKYAIGVGSGTDALFLSMKALGIGAGDEVITMTSTFIATVGAIVATGARPVLIDCDDEYIMDVSKIEAAITSKTRAILPVHYAGHPVRMKEVMEIAKKHKLFVVEDACQAIGAKVGGKIAGSIGDAGAFSLHPLKNINVWSDGGVITTNSAELNAKLRLLRNHGMKNRDEYSIFGYNSRLDTVQAAVGLRLFATLDSISKKRRDNAARYDKQLGTLKEWITVPKRRADAVYVYHLYILQVKHRDKLLAYLNKNGIEAKVHYPMPLHVQECAKDLGYKHGDFPVAEEQAKKIITLPAHQHLTKSQIDYTISMIKKFYAAQK